MSVTAPAAPTMADVLRGLFDWQHEDPDRHRLHHHWIGRKSLAISAASPGAGPIYATFLTPVSAASARRIVEDQLREGPCRSIVIDGGVIDATPDADLEGSITLIDAED